MNVLGICASYRKLGNTEILLREALEACSDQGHKTQLIRLTDYDIQPCKGCMACVFKNEACRITDDMASLIETMEEYDRLLMGSPTYVLSPPGIIKMVIDRLFMAQDTFKGKKASTIGVAALPDWEPLVLPMLNMFVLSFGYELVDSSMVYGAGPGEVLLDTTNIEMARNMGKRLVSKNPEPQRTNACPVCRSTFVSLNTMTCPVCNLGISFQDGKVVYDSPEHHRFTEEGRAEHLENWILKTEGKYFAEIDTIKKLKKKYQ
jgi:multimeric flavodoxin WrbA